MYRLFGGKQQESVLAAYLLLGETLDALVKDATEALKQGFTLFQYKAPGEISKEAVIVKELAKFLTKEHRATLIIDGNDGKKSIHIYI